MLKYTNLFNFGLAGALIVPSIKQQLDSPQRIEESLRSTFAFSSPISRRRSSSRVERSRSPPKGASVEARMRCTAL